MADDARLLLERLRQTPDLAKAIPQLQPQVLHRVIQHCGLEECAEIVALATPAQIERVLDVDLWRARAPGRDEAFDAHRFGEWLEVLMQAGESVAVEKIAAIDIGLIVAGFSQHVSVFDAAAVSSYVTLDGDEVGGRSFDRSATADIGGFVVEARRSDAWEAIVDVLTSLNVERCDYFRRLMRACVALSSGEREEDASHHLLDDRGQDMFDLASTREARRDAMGYVTPADARAFLHAGRELRTDGAQPPPDPVALAYVRSLAAVEANEVGTTPSADGAPDSTDSPVNAAAVTAVMDALLDAGITTQPRALLTAGGAGSSRLPHVGAHLAAHPHGADELAFLTNLMMAGGAIQGRPLTAAEAPELVAATCNLGLEGWPKEWPHPSLVAAFQVGWKILYRDVCLYAAGSVIDTLATVHTRDRDIQLMINQLRRELIRHGQAGMPWKAQDSFDAIMMLDAAAWAVLLRLIDETPTLHPVAASEAAAVRTVNPADFEFIADKRQVQAARGFLAGLAMTLQA